MTNQLQTDISSSTHGHVGADGIAWSPKIDRTHRRPSTSNMSYRPALRPAEPHGAGCPGIRNAAGGLVLISMRSPIPANSTVWSPTISPRGWWQIRWRMGRARPSHLRGIDRASFRSRPRHRQ